MRIILFNILVGMAITSQIHGKAGFDKPALGVVDGKLATCPASPNCVSTQADPSDKVHYIEPIRYTTTRQQAKDAILESILEIKKVTIITNTDDYIYAEFRTPLMNFTDDVEFYFPDNEPVIHFRSASRIGYGDMGTNRKRMEDVRKRFMQKVSK